MRWLWIRQGFWQGVGFEASFLLLYGVWLMLYQNQGHKFSNSHFIHKIHDYFTS